MQLPLGLLIDLNQNFALKCFNLEIWFGSVLNMKSVVYSVRLLKEYFFGETKLDQNVLKLCFVIWGLGFLLSLLAKTLPDPRPISLRLLLFWPLDYFPHCSSLLTVIIDFFPLSFLFLLAIALNFFILAPLFSFVVALDCETQTCWLGIDSSHPSRVSIFKH